MTSSRKPPGRRSANHRLKAGAGSSRRARSRTASHAARAGEPMPSAADCSLTDGVIYPQALSTSVETADHPWEGDEGSRKARRIIALASSDLPRRGRGLGDLFVSTRPVYSARAPRERVEGRDGGSPRDL